MNNAELIKALRYCGNFADRDGCDEECPYFNDKDCPKRIMCDAADALEAAEKRIAELEAQLPKEGEWIPIDDGDSIYDKCSVCGKNYYGLLTEIEFLEEYHYCPNCGAKMRTVTDCHTLVESER